MNPNEMVWPCLPLSNLCDIKIGRTPERANAEYWGPGYPWLSIADMQQGKNLAVTKETITQKAVDKCRCYQVQPGTLLMSFKLSIGKLGFVRVPMYTNEAIAALIIRNQKQIVPNFLYYALQVVDLVGNTDRAVKGKTLDTEKLSLLPIPLPSAAEQYRIASILAKADHLRRLRRYALELSGMYLQTVFLEMFGDPVTNPKQWPIGYLFQLCVKIVDCPHATPIYTREPTPYACIRSSDIQNGFLDWSTTKYVDISEYKKRVKIAVPKPQDVVYCREGARFGNAAIIPVRKQVCLGQRTMLFRAATHIATPEFIWAFLESESTYRQAVKMAGGSASPHLNVRDIKEFATVIPPLPLQETFSQIVQRYTHLRTQQREALRQAEHLFQTLLHRAFQGERISDQADIPSTLIDHTEHCEDSHLVISDGIDTNAYQPALPLE